MQMKKRGTEVLAAGTATMGLTYNIDNKYLVSDMALRFQQNHFLFKGFV
jgi:hypothetical protein